MQEWFDSLPSFNTLLGLDEPQAQGGDLTVGSFVEYHSSSHNTWIPAKVVAVNPDGTLDLDCKPKASRDRIRAGTFRPPEYEVGSVVEYWSESQGGWIKARVLRYNAYGGTYDLDCKPEVLSEKMRPLRALGGVKEPPAARQALTPIPEGGSLEALAEDATVPLEPVPAPLRAMDDLTRTLAPASLQATLVSTSLTSAGTGPQPKRRQSPPAPSTGPTVQTHHEAPVQLISVSRRGGAWHFQANQEALQVLESFGHTPVAICAVCGPYRSGKSYLLNLLLERVQGGLSQFEVGSAARACTEGVWMWGASHADAAAGTKTIFLDCEGFGSIDSDKTRDAKLMSLLVLLSSVFLLNTKGVFNEGLFNALSLVCSFAKHLQASEAELQQSPPSLVWLLRDFVLDLQDDAGNAITADQYLEKSLQVNPMASADPRAEASREVRQTLLRFFPRRRCFTLPQPMIEEDRLQRLSQVDYNQLRPAFRSSFEALKAEVVRLASAQPKTLRGQPLTGAALAAVLPQLLQALNADRALNVASTWDQVQQSTCDSVKMSLLKEAERVLKEVQEGGPLPTGKRLPVADAALAETRKAMRRQLRQRWRAEAVGDEDVRQEHWQELKKSLEPLEKAVVQANEQLGQQELQPACADWQAWISQEDAAAASDERGQALATLLERGLPSRPAFAAAAEALAIARRARLRWDSTRSALQAEFELVKQELASKEAAVAEMAAAPGAEGVQSEKETRLLAQIQELENAARVSIQRERALREQLLDAQEELRNANHGYGITQQRCKELEKEAETLQGQVEELTKVAQDYKESQERRAVPEGRQPKCACSIM